MTRAGGGAALFTVALLAAACSGGDGEATPTTTEQAPTTSTTTTADDSTTTNPETTTTVAVDPDDDADGNGELDPFCGEADYGGGLVLQVHCDIEGYTLEVPENVSLAPSSLYGLRSSIHRNPADVSGHLIVSRAPDGSRVLVIVFQSDVLFASGSTDLGEAQTFDGVVAFVNSDFPGSAIQVRGHTDGVGDPGSNQVLSEARAAAVQAYLTAQGIDATEVTTTGFGETQPLALDDTEEGKAFNRRVEVVIRPPSG